MPHPGMLDVFFKVDGRSRVSVPGTVEYQRQPIASIEFR
jgi:hypothetical protein